MEYSSSLMFSTIQKCKTLSELTGCSKAAIRSDVAHQQNLPIPGGREIGPGEPVLTLRS